MKLDNFTAWVQAVLSGLYLLFTFTVILVYELGLSKLTNQGQEKTFDSMVSWMTGGALIVLYFWLQRAKGQSIPDPERTTTTTTQQIVTTPSKPPEPPNAPPATETHPEPPVVPAAAVSLRDPEP